MWHGKEKTQYQKYQCSVYVALLYCTWQPKCVYIRVYIRLNYFQQGETWSPTDIRCDEYTCVKNGEILTTSTSHTVCPVFNESSCQPVSINFLIIHLVCLHSVRSSSPKNITLQFTVLARSLCPTRLQHLTTCQNIPLLRTLFLLI